MNFIWDMVLNAQRHGTDEANLYFMPARECSPWYEQSFPCLNEMVAEGPSLEYNPLYRFDALFHEMLHVDMREAPEFRERLFDLVSHLLVQIDLHHGLSKREYHIRRLQRELSDGSFGPSVAEGIREVEPEKEWRVAALVLAQLQSGSSLLLFRKAVRVLFPDGLLYQERPHPTRILLYTGQVHTEALARKAVLIQELFLPIHFDLRIFWARHFGVVGVDAVMKLDVIEIY